MCTTVNQRGQSTLVRKYALRAVEGEDDNSNAHRGVLWCRGSLHDPALPTL